MWHKTKYDEKEVECRACHQKVNPLIKRNTLKQNFYGQRFSGMEKKYLLVCPNCKAVIGSTNSISPIDINIKNKV